MNRIESALAAGPPPLWLDADAYAARLLAQDAPPWLDSSAYIAWQCKTVALLEPGIAALKLAPIVVAWLGQAPATLAAMRASRRTVAPLKALLADQALRAHLLTIVVGLRASHRQLPLALTLPSPHRWLAEAHGLACGTAPAFADDDIDAAAMYLADFLRGFADAGVDLLLLEETSDSAPRSAAALACYQAVLNLAGHLRWGIGLHLPGDACAALDYAGIDFLIAAGAAPGICHGLALGPAFWAGDARPALPPATFPYVEVPADAVPERVLARLAELRTCAA